MTRTKQQKAESESYAILLYKLKGLGIFRNQTESDYGIDFEIELISADGAVAAEYFKAQVKSAENIYVRGDGIPTVGGIKQSTLRYWCELSFRTHVIAYAVDLTTEKTYVSRPLFWQATRLLDGTDTSKTIEFMRPVDKVDPVEFVRLVTTATAHLPRVTDVIYALTMAFRRLPKFLELRMDANHYDAWSAVDDTVLFRDFLEVCAILIGPLGDDAPLSALDRAGAFSFEHWAKKSDPDGLELTWQGAREPLNNLLPTLIVRLGEYRNMIMAGEYYWSYKNPQFLTMVVNASLPPATDDDTLDEWGENFEQMRSKVSGSISYVIAQARSKVEKPDQSAGSASGTHSGQVPPTDSSTAVSSAAAPGDSPAGKS
ncbi:DUF4365 domain-containing protein [Bradyrhizobium japonicum]|uniref:DUF4365 domain-containing protein n=1 Tax=Bradyrhizobium japonicum TaxID=375 RepID=UPI0035147708